MFPQYVLLFLGVFACSTSAVFIRLSTVNPFVLTAMRLLIAVALLSPVFRLELRRHGAAFTKDHLSRTRLPALVLAAHLITWTLGARMTVVAQSSLIVNLVPIALPFLLHWIAAERINRAEILGTALAIVGLLVLSVKDALTAGGSVVGDVTCFGSMLLFALYLALGRRNRDFPSVWLYVIPVYGQAALICLVVALPWLATLAGISLRDWLILVALGAIPTVCGHSLLNAAMRTLRGQVVSLCNMMQFVFAGVMGFILFEEAPHAVFYVASAMAVAGVAVVVLAAPAATDPTPQT
jgi:drug/metabolite transporter (DMT)-like permease